MSEMIAVVSTDAPTDRERYCTLLFNGPLLSADAAVVLCGEDARPRLSVAAQVLASGGVRSVVLSGGLNRPPRWMGAESMAPLLMGAGVSPSRITVEPESLNTREQAVNVIQVALRQDWHRLLIIASAYHTPRAHLTFVRRLNEIGEASEIHVLAVPASHTRWFEPPEGMDRTRIELLEEEFRKIEEYREHVATYQEGLEYLRAWEGR